MNTEIKKAMDPDTGIAMYVLYARILLQVIMTLVLRRCMIMDPWHLIWRINLLFV